MPKSERYRRAKEILERMEAEEKADRDRILNQHTPTKKEPRRSRPERQKTQPPQLQHVWQWLGRVGGVLLEILVTISEHIKAGVTIYVLAGTVFAGVFVGLLIFGEADPNQENEYYSNWPNPTCRDITVVRAGDDVTKPLFTVPDNGVYIKCLGHTYDAMECSVSKWDLVSSPAIVGGFYFTHSAVQQPLQSLYHDGEARRVEG